MYKEVEKRELFLVEIVHQTLNGAIVVVVRDVNSLILEWRKRIRQKRSLDLGLVSANGLQHIVL